MLKFFLLYLFLSIIILQANDRYIIVLKKQTISHRSTSNKIETTRQIANRLLKISNTLKSTSSINDNKIIHVYDKVLNGFSADLNYQTLQDLENNPEVKSIEKSYKVIPISIQSPTSSWGLDRVDERNRVLDQQYHYNYTGKGVHVYVLDTGIHYSHTEFKNRIGNGKDFRQNDNISNDEGGHGTHVSGTILGTNYGIAKDAVVHPIKVLNNNGGTIDGVIAGIDWIINNHTKPAVINMSIGLANHIGTIAAWNTAINNAINHGITFVIAAGNSNIDASKTSPSNVSNAIVVGASTSYDSKASYSNYGHTVDLLAPGSSITSSWINGINNIATISGTSMASPHVVGVIAKYLEKYPNATPTQVSNFIVSSSTKDKINNLSVDTPNRLLYGFIEFAKLEDNQINVLSNNHSSGRNYYFNFNVSDVEAAIGRTLQQGENLIVKNIRTGRMDAAVFWNTPNGGSIGNGHGRWSSGSKELWKVGDVIEFTP